MNVGVWMYEYEFDFARVREWEVNKPLHVRLENQTKQVPACIP